MPASPVPKPVDMPREPIADLNTTPLIDVMLVLLIMFIITMPLATHAVKVDVPPPVPGVVVDQIKNRIDIAANGVISWNGIPVDRQGLRARIAATQRFVVEPMLLLAPDADARYETVDGVIADIKRSGASKLAFVGNDQYGRF